MIYCFSGNGNSAFVARFLADKLGDTVTVIDRDALRHAGALGGEMPRVVWVFPVYSWGLPLPVVAFMRRVGIKGARHYAVMTCGDDTGLAPRQWRREAASRGWNAAGAFSVTMPNTFTAMPGFDVDKPEVAEAKLAAAPGRVGEVAAMIDSGFDGDDVVTGSLPRLKSAVVYPWFMKRFVNPRKFVCDISRCISCGRCVEACPMDNVTLSDGHPVWGSECALCLACCHVCPVHAVNYGKATVGKGRYRMRE